MSINNDDQINNRREFLNNFSIYRNNFVISSCKNAINTDRNKKFNEFYFEPSESFMLQKKINNQNCESRNFINSHSMINIKPNFHKKKNDFYFNKDFRANPNVEEIPTFSYENDLNVNSFRSFMNRQNEILKKNYENFMKYMKKHENEQRKKQLISPYSLYVKKINDVKKYEKHFLPKIRQREIQNLKLKINRNDNQNDFNNNKNFNSFILANKIKHEQFDLDKYLEEVDRNKEKNKAIENNKEIEIEKNIEKENNNENNLPVSKSINDNKKYFPKNNEISNPELFYKKGNKEFYEFRKEYKKFDDYNYKLILLHSKNRFVKKEPDIKPYNRKINSFKIGNSSLAPNVILRPDDCYGNFKNISSMN
jgi:hypothetical protein